MHCHFKIQYLIYMLKQKIQFAPLPKPAKVLPLNRLIKSVILDAPQNAVQPNWNFDDAVKQLAAFKTSAQKKSPEELVSDFVAADRRVCNLDKFSNQQSVLARLEAGYALRELRKKARYGTFIKLITEKAPDLSRTSVNRYIRAAEAYPDPRKIPSTVSTMDLYRKAKILGKSADSDPTPEAKGRKMAKTMIALEKQLTAPFQGKESLGKLPAHRQVRLTVRIGALIGKLDGVLRALELNIAEQTKKNSAAGAEVAASEPATTPPRTCEARTSPAPTVAPPASPCPQPPPFAFYSAQNPPSTLPPPPAGTPSGKTSPPPPPPGSEAMPTSSYRPPPPPPPPQ
jgi:hypothetical protein